MAKFTKETTDFYRRCADQLDAIRRGIPGATRIDSKFAAFLTTAAREIREGMEDVSPKVVRAPVKLRSR